MVVVREPTVHLDHSDDSTTESCDEKGEITSGMKTQSGFGGGGGESFLPLCDVVFNVISLAEYFCSTIFDLVLVYALYSRGFKLFFVVLCIVLNSLVVSQIVSLKWFLGSGKRRDPEITTPDQIENQSPVAPKLEARKHRYVVVLHVFQLGVLWRYAKLLVPVNLQNIKHEVRDLCMIRLLHAFLESAPMLLLQLHVLVSMQTDENKMGSSSSSSSTELRLKTIGDGHILPSGPHSYPTSAILLQQNRTFKDLNTISAMLSLFSVCWALASFSKNVRRPNVHRLVLTWLGVIFQFFWRLGTVISRVTALTVYASLYKSWVFLVIVLHWLSMLLWLISPKNVFHGEKISRTKKTLFSAMIAFVYVFAYINLQEVNHRHKMASFYVVMFLENVLLVCLWMVGIWPERDERWMLVPITVLASFAVGILFMLTYYRYFHVRRLGFADGGRPEMEEYPANSKPSGKSSGGASGAKYNAPAVPGVFNCRFTNPVHGATKRKKKKPTSFVPPPNLKIPNGPNASSLLPAHQAAQPQHLTALQNQIQVQNCDSPLVVQHQYSGGPMAIPFWKQPLVAQSHNGSSENESSVGSRVNIQQKLQEKKQKQLAELKVIEEEIKQGKLVGPHNPTGTLSSNEDTTRQPIPRIKKHDLDTAKFYDNLSGYSNMMALQSCYTDASDVDATYGTAYVVNHHQPSPASSSFGPTNNLSSSRAVIAKSKVPRTFHQNIQTNNSPVIPLSSGREVVHHPDTNTSNSNKSSSNQSQTRGRHLNPGANFNIRQQQQLLVEHRTSPSVHDSQFNNNAYSNSSTMMVPSQKMDSNRGTPIQNAQINSPMMHILHRQQQQQQQQQPHRMTPSEVLLSPHPYLEQGGMHPKEFYDNWNGGAGSGVAGGGGGVGGVGGGSLSSEEEEDNTHHPPSDIDSQMSRSYTLPREFKYNRKHKSRKMDNFVASNNSSSDGDVDSVDDNESPANVSASKHQHYYHMTRRQQAAAQMRNPPMATGRISVPAVGNQPIYLNSPHSYVRNLDLISNVLDGTVVGQQLTSPSRRVRYPGGGRGEPRHETKL